MEQLLMSDAAKWAFQTMPLILTAIHMISSFFQMTKPRLREGKHLVQGRTATSLYLGLLWTSLMASILMLIVCVYTPFTVYLPLSLTTYTVVNLERYQPYRRTSIKIWRLNKLCMHLL